MCFGGDIRARQLERSIGGLQSQGYCVERLSLLNVEAVEIFFMLMRDDFLKYFQRGLKQGLCMPDCVQTYRLYSNITHDPI